MRLGVALLAGAALVVGGCQHHGSQADQNVVRVVPGPASAYASIAVSAQGRTAEVSGDLRDQLAPLLAARRLSSPGPPSDYGLDRPQARLFYRARDGRTVEVAIGAPNFDRHFVYGQVAGSRPVDLLLGDAIRPTLALVGIDVPPAA